MAWFALWGSTLARVGIAFAAAVSSAGIAMTRIAPTRTTRGEMSSLSSTIMVTKSSQRIRAILNWRTSEALLDIVGKTVKNLA